MTCMAARNKKQLKVSDDAKDILDYNKDMELTVVNLVKVNKDCKGLSKANILFDATLEIFDKKMQHRLPHFTKHVS